MPVGVILLEGGDLGGIIWQIIGLQDLWFGRHFAVAANEPELLLEGI